MKFLGILLPVTSRGSGASLARLLACLTRLGTSLGSHPTAGPRLSVCLGIDEDDQLLQSNTSELQRCFRPAVATAVHTFSAAQLAEQRRWCGDAAPLCWMWSELAEQAMQAFSPEWLLLLGDDTEVAPAGWPRLLADFVSSRQRLRCVALLDASDPGFPSFPAVASSHLRLFGRMLPEELRNQGGDPLLWELYRSFGAAAVCAQVTVRNLIGGPLGSPFAIDGEQVPPRYARCPLPVPRWRAVLEHSRQVFESKVPEVVRRLQVGVLVPSYRVQPTALSIILDRSRSSHADVDVRVLIQVDNPKPSHEALAWLRAQQSARMDGLRVRISASNQGAAAARNHLLDEAAACDLLIFFDDDVAPAQRCVDAYVGAFKQHPHAVGFAGPTLLALCPDQLLPTAIHMSDVSFFWEAPATLGPTVPWAVTANMALRNTHVRLRDGFPKTGGGEDVDICVQLGAQLVAVPEAHAAHPWWPQRRPRIYMRFWGWAQGDGRLVALWPGLTYRRAPNLGEMYLLLMVVSPLLLVCRLTSAPAVGGCLLAIPAADLVCHVMRNCCLEQRRRQHPCAAWWLRPLAAAEAWVIAALFSEGGRLAGHLRRQEWRSLFRNFDWFCGGQPGVVAEEQRRVAARCACCLLSAAAAWVVLQG